MKSGLSHSFLAIAAATLGTPSPEGSTSRPMKLRPPLPCPNIFFQPLRIGGASQSPPYNQRKVRKARRARFAAGDRRAFA